MRRRWLALVPVALLACWVIYIITRPGPPSVLLPDGTRITWHSASRGRPAAKSSEGYAMFQHFASSNDSRLRDAWLWLRQQSPNWLRTYLPNWPARSVFHSGTWINELELRFLVEGSLTKRQWRIGIADDDGWETDFNEMGWEEGQPASSVAPARPGQLSLATPWPRHSKTLRLRFHPTERLEPKLTDARKRETLAELVMQNPFYEGPAAAPTAPAPPVTKITRFGEITLTRFRRSRLVGSDFGGLSMQFDARRNGAPMADMSLDCESITDRSGQWFRMSRQGGSSNGKGIYGTTLYVAPWSDDPSWKIRMKLRRNDYCLQVDEAEMFRFDHLPVPQGTRTEVNRSITRNGITLRIAAIELSPEKDWRFCVEGWRPGNKDRDHWILLQDARDDQGRTHAKKQNGNFRIVGGPVGGKPEGPVYAVHLPPDAQWWELTLVPETIETVEFEARPTFLK